MKFEKEYFIHYYESDLKRRAAITGIMQYFEDIAILQSESRGVGLDYYEKNKVAWVLYKWDITIHSYPVYKQTVRVITEPLTFHKFYAFRTFEIRSTSGELLVSAVSLWLFVDTNTRRPMKINEDMYRGYGLADPLPAPPPMEDARQLNQCGQLIEFKVRRSDIDTNNHVNNIKYVDWALEAVPFEIIENYSIKRLKITYKKETNYGSRISSMIGTERDENKVACLHKITEDNNDLCILETVWEKD